MQFFLSQDFKGILVGEIVPMVLHKCVKIIVVQFYGKFFGGIEFLKALIELSGSEKFVPCFVVVHHLPVVIGIIVVVAA